MLLTVPSPKFMMASKMRSKVEGTSRVLYFSVAPFAVRFFVALKVMRPPELFARSRLFTFQR